MDTILCPKCGNTVPKNQKICIYCQAPLSSKPYFSRKNKRNLRLSLIVGFIFLAIAIENFPDIVQFRGNTKTIFPVSQPVANKPAIEEKQPDVEDTALVAYKHLTKAIEQDDEETAEHYVNNARWHQLKLEQDEPSAIEELKPRCDVEKKFESQDMEDRAVLTAKSKPFKDQDGQSSFTVFVVDMAKEDDQWKVFSSSCIYGAPSDYMQEEQAWIFEQSAIVGDDLNSKLIANGLPDGELSCFIAVDRGHPNAVKKCFETGWSVDAEDSDGRKAIDLALAKMEYASPENNEVIELFVKEGANIDRP
jgi:hypothetical protein